MIKNAIMMLLIDFSWKLNFTSIACKFILKHQLFFTVYSKKVVPDLGRGKVHRRVNPGWRPAVRLLETPYDRIFHLFCRGAVAGWLTVQNSRICERNPSWVLAIISGRTTGSSARQRGALSRTWNMGFHLFDCLPESEVWCGRVDENGTCEYQEFLWMEFRIF